MENKTFFQKFNENNKGIMSSNDRYNNKNLILINTSNSNSSAFSNIVKIENLKKKYNRMNLQQKLNLKNTYNKILNLKKKYNSNDNLKKINTEPSNKENVMKLNNNFLIQTTDKLSLINKSLDKKSMTKLYLNTDNIQLDNCLTISEYNRLEKSHEINYQIKSKTVNKMNKLNLKMLKNYSEQNNKTIREELLKFGKNIKQYLNENALDENNENKQDNDNTIINKHKSKSVRPIKERINILASVKNRIKKINKDLFKENEKNENPNISIDSQIDINFKHIKPLIMKENSIEDYFKEEQKNNTLKDNLLKPVLIRSLPRPKLNIPKYPSFFFKSK
jgi:hypothetical protein